MSYFEEVCFIIDIVDLLKIDYEVKNLCDFSGVDIENVVFFFKMSWEGELDWDENEIIKGSCVLVLIFEDDNLKKGKLLCF